MSTTTSKSIPVQRELKNIVLNNIPLQQAIQQMVQQVPDDYWRNYGGNPRIDCTILLEEHNGELYARLINVPQKTDGMLFKMPKEIYNKVFNLVQKLPDSYDQEAA